MFKLHPQLFADTVPIGDLPLCRVLLVNDSQYPWLVLVPRRVDILETYQLSEDDQQQLLIESNTLSSLLMNHFNGNKLNVAALGNMVPQLHIHHIVRFTNDPTWPKPVWGMLPSRPYQQGELNSTIHELTKLVSSKFNLKPC